MAIESLALYNQKQLGRSLNDSLVIELIGSFQFTNIVSFFELYISILDENFLDLVQIQKL